MNKKKTTAYKIMLVHVLAVAACSEAPLYPNAAPDIEELDVGAEEIDVNREETDTGEDALSPPCKPGETVFDRVHALSDGITKQGQYMIAQAEDNRPTFDIWISNEQTEKSELLLYYTNLTPERSKLKGLDVGDVVDVMVTSGDRCGYTVIRDLSGKILLEGGNRCYSCPGNPAGFEEVCNPRLRPDFEAPPREERCRIVETAGADEQACANQWEAYPMYVRDDNGEREIFPDHPLKLTVEGAPYLAFLYSGGLIDCPCVTHCVNVRLDFLMVPLEGLLP